MDRFNGVIPPTEVLVHVSFEEAETMLTENGGWQVLSYCATAKGELDFHYWKQRQGFDRWFDTQQACGWQGHWHHSSIGMGVEGCDT